MRFLFKILVIILILFVWILALAMSTFFFGKNIIVEMILMSAMIGGVVAVIRYKPKNKNTDIMEITLDKSNRQDK